MEWAFPTRTFQRMGLHGKAKGPNGIDERFASRSASGIGVGIMGRNKFPAAAGLVGRRAVAGLVGNNPAFHTPVIVLTHSGGLDVRIGGGVSTIRRFLGADLIHRTHIVLVPIILGRDERLWENTEGLEQRLPHRGGTLTQRCHPPDIRPTAPTRLTGRAIAGSHRSGGWRGSRAAVSPPPRPVSSSGASATWASGIPGVARNGLRRAAPFSGEPTWFAADQGRAAFTAVVFTAHHAVAVDLGRG